MHVWVAEPHSGPDRVNSLTPAETLSAATPCRDGIQRNCQPSATDHIALHDAGV